eukprot:TRINITY_DN3448_c0_g1_i1.p1 TRINITY_DN3448_c0_g1~~TRINITY_DN3448_c0_g1_i1.p1  ORF type:complete len:442 (+),score=106.73 TRINITY_DN3448_c0_g1_i1:32-1357(+)
MDTDDHIFIPFHSEEGKAGDPISHIVFSIPTQRDDHLHQNKKEINHHHHGDDVSVESADGFDEGMNDDSVESVSGSVGREKGAEDGGGLKGDKGSVGVRMMGDKDSVLNAKSISSYSSEIVDKNLNGAGIKNLRRGSKREGMASSGKNAESCVSSSTFKTISESQSHEKKNEFGILKHIQSESSSESFSGPKKSNYTWTKIRKLSVSSSSSENSPLSRKSVRVMKSSGGSLRLKNKVRAKKSFKSKKGSASSEASKERGDMVKSSSGVNVRQSHTLNNLNLASIKKQNRMSLFVKTTNRKTRSKEKVPSEKRRKISLKSETEKNRPSQGESFTDSRSMRRKRKGHTKSKRLVSSTSSKSIHKRKSRRKSETRSKAKELSDKSENKSSPKVKLSKSGRKKTLERRASKRDNKKEARKKRRKRSDVEIIKKTKSVTINRKGTV